MENCETNTTPQIASSLFTQQVLNKCSLKNRKGKYVYSVRGATGTPQTI